LQQVFVMLRKRVQVEKVMPPGSAAECPLAVQHLTRSFGSGDMAVHALCDVSFRVAQAGMIALLGRSGSGKSTLLQLIGAVDRPTRGTIEVGGRSLAGMSETQLARFRRRQLGFVFQSFELVDSLTVFDNVALPWLLDGAMNRQRTEEVGRLLERLEIADLGQRFPDQLSGGEQQRVALARAIVRRPALVLADEPTGNLDSRTGAKMLDLIGELQEEMSLVVIMATHDPRVAERCRGRIVVEDGRIAAVDGRWIVDGAAR
jgi:putative ABC transport system ATP-binding protein